MKNKRKYEFISNSGEDSTPPIDTIFHNKIRGYLPSPPKQPCSDNKRQRIENNSVKIQLNNAYADNYYMDVEE